MNLLERAGLAVLHRIDPEQAHDLAHKALKAGFGPKPGPISSPRLQTTLAGMTLANPLGLAAGFDKNATLLHPLAHCGFGFLEVGAVTPRAQPGNPKPRLFRLGEDRAVINRFGFNNQGMEAAAERLAARPHSLPIGLNLGANKDSTDRAGDFARVLSHCGGFLDFATVNVSSPNTEKLRDLQGKDALAALLAGVMEARAGLPRRIPVFLKIAPDLSEAELAEMVRLGHRAFMFFLVQRTDCSRFDLARDIDPGYAAAFDITRQQGVEFLCYDTTIGTDGVELGRPVAPVT